MKWKNFFLLFILAGMWGPSYLFIKLAIEEITPFTLAAGRTAIGALLLVVMSKFQLPRFGRVWWHIFVNGLFATSIPYILFGYGEQHISSGLAGVINGTTPIVAAFLAHFFLLGERLNFSRFVGVLLGFSGFLVLILPHLCAEMLHASLRGVLAIGIASACYAIAMIYSKKYLLHLSPIPIAASQAVCASFYLIPISLLSESGIPTMTWNCGGALIGLGVLGTAGAYFLYYYLMQRVRVTFLALATYLLPLFSTILGTVFLGESLTWMACLAGGLILMGMMIVNGTIRLPVLITQEELK